MVPGEARASAVEPPFALAAVRVAAAAFRLLFLPMTEDRIKDADK